MTAMAFCDPGSMGGGGKGGSDPIGQRAGHSMTNAITIALAQGFVDDDERLFQTAMRISTLTEKVVTTLRGQSGGVSTASAPTAPSAPAAPSAPTAPATNVASVGAPGEVVQYNQGEGGF